MKLADLLPGNAELRATMTAIGIAIAAVSLVGLVLGVRSCIQAPAREDAAQANVARSVALGSAGAAQDATAITGNVMAAIAVTDKQTEAGNDAIDKAQGSSAKIDPALSDAGIRALCMRRAYVHQPRCIAMQQTGPQTVK